MGVDVNARTLAGCTPLFFAVVNGERSFVDLLLSSGARQSAYSADIRATMVKVSKSITTATRGVGGDHEALSILQGTGMSSLAKSMTEKMVAAFAADFDVLESLVAADRVRFYLSYETKTPPQAESAEEGDGGDQHQQHHAAATTTHSDNRNGSKQKRKQRVPAELAGDLSRGHKSIGSEKIAVQSILGHLCVGCAVSFSFVESVVHGGRVRGCGCARIGRMTLLLCWLHWFGWCMENTHT